MSVVKMKDDKFEKDETFIMPSVHDNEFELEEDEAPIEIEFDADFLIIDGCNSEGALEREDLLELDEYEYDGRGRGSDAGI